MSNLKFKSFMYPMGDTRGFTLTEVIIIMIIVAILATGVVFMFTDPTAKVKAAAFEMRGDFNLARAEAVRRNENILIQFVTSAQETCAKDSKANFDACFAGGSLHGYVLCYNENQGTDNDCSDEVRSSPPATAAEVAADLEEKIIKTVLLRNAIHYYETDATLPSSPIGPTPTNAPDGEALVSNDGITFTNGNYIYMHSDGTSSDAGSVVIYYPENGNTASKVVKGKPYGVVVDNMNTGRVVLERWRPDLGVSGEWSRK